MARIAKFCDLSTTGLNLAVRYGKGTWPVVEMGLMFNNDIFRVCAPSYLEKHGPLRSAPDLLGTTLLKLSQFDRNWTTWDTWFEEFDLDEAKATKSLWFDNYLLLVHAAVRGEGVSCAGGAWRKI